MDRDQDKFLEDERKPRQTAGERPEQPTENAPPYENDDDHTYLMNLLDYLQDAIESGSSVPLTGKRLVDAGMCLDIIKDIRGNLPLAIQYAEQVMRDRDRILSGAERAAASKIQSADVRANAALDDASMRSQEMLEQAESRADKIIKDAEIRARAMIDQHAVTTAAQNEAREIVNEARADASEKRLEASAYSENLMINVEKELQRAADMIRQRRQQLNAQQ
jgi:vacuolar-type H+-ATPase subunit H